jgi:cytochrome c553
MSAASGHWAVTQWFLEFSQRRSIATHSLRVGEAPPLDDPALALRGAGHYETGCRRCHGVPGGQVPVALREMLPRPPDLRFVATRYSTAELFHVVKHGLKFTGMPGWPALQRDDEVWAMVAFLQTLPAIGPQEYDGVVFGAQRAAAAAAPPVVASACARCHGFDGLGRVPGAFPVLAGQRAAYLHASLRAFAYGGRVSGIMSAVASPLGDDAMRQAAEYYASLPGLGSDADAVPAAQGDEGLAIAMRGVPAQKVPSCAACHGPGTAPRNDVYPILTGQYPRYIELQLRLFRERIRGGTAYAHLMHEPADHLTQEQMAAVARYYGR